MAEGSQLEPPGPAAGTPDLLKCELVRRDGRIVDCVGRPMVAIRSDGGLEYLVEERLGAVRGETRSLDRSESLPDAPVFPVVHSLAICV